MPNSYRLLATVAVFGSLAAGASRAADAAVDAAAAPANAASAPVRARPPGAAASRPANPAANPATNPADRPATQQVEITGSTGGADNNDERRRSTASRITYGREELDKMGDSTLGEVLKRLPGVTIGGPPGRGGQIRMRGMGGGYTQILIDGQRMAPGFSLDSIAPEQIEKIEIMRAPVAEFGTRAIAGTINVIMRSDFKRKANEFRLGGGADGGHSQVGASWIANGQTETLGYNLSATLFQGGQGSLSDTHTLGLDANGSPVLDRQLHSDSNSTRTGLYANARLQFKLAPGSTLDLQPFFSASRSRSQGLATVNQTVPIPGSATANPTDPAPSYQDANWVTNSDWQMARLNGTWLTGLAGGRLQSRFGSTLSQSSSLTERTEQGYSAGTAGRKLVDDNGARDLSLELSGKFSQLLAERHSASAGYELAAGRRTDRRKTSTDGVADPDQFGESIQARTSRMALYAQDEWDWSPTFSFYAGARWEAIGTASDSAQGRVSNRSAVLTPLAHMVWKLPDAPRDQIRLSLTRSYRSPDTNQLVGRLTRNSQYRDPSIKNTATTPDRAGNPDLLPELAWGLELGAEHYLDAGGLFSANLFLRKIDNLIRNVRSQDAATTTTAQRWVARPQNIGTADAAGIELEAKARLSDLWDTELPISLRSNLTLMTSRVSQVMGPYNRLEGQPPYTANLGADWPFKGTPLTVGSSLNFTPSFTLQQIDNQTYRQGVKNVVDGYALWRFSPDASARLSVSNAAARRYDTGTTTVLANASGGFAGSESSDTSLRSTTTINLRGEFRF